jgi:RNA polymerase sigma factor (sigma-70 family)
VTPLTDEQRALAEAYVPWVRRVMIVGLLRLWWDDPAEVESAALMGLLMAAQKFDGRQGVKFTTYATIVIRGYVRDQRRRLMVERGFSRSRRPGERQQRIATIQTLLDVDGAQVPAEVANIDRALLLAHVFKGARNARDARIISALLRGYTQNDIAKRLGIGESRISQLINGIVERARAQASSVRKAAA